MGYLSNLRKAIYNPRKAASRLSYETQRMVGDTDYQPFIVLARSRTGSNLLNSYLNSHPNVAADGEIFGWLSGRTPQGILNSAYGKQPRHISAKGFKIFYYHPEDGGNEIWHKLLAMPNLCVIHLKRRNILRTLVSRKIAGMQGVWQDTGKNNQKRGANGPVSFTAEELSDGFQRTRAWEQAGDEMFADHPLLSLDYEDLVSDPGTTFRQVTDFLSLDPMTQETQNRRQNPQSIRELIANYEGLKSEFANTQWASFFEA